MSDTKSGDVDYSIAERWCSARGPGWSIKSGSGSGGTSRVFVVSSPDGNRALKLINEKFSSGDLGEITLRRIEQEKLLGQHDCPYLVRVFDGGKFEDRLFVLMSVASGKELEKRLKEIPRTKIRSIVDQITQACEFLRARGFCHRDIKSSNIFITDDFSHATLLDLSVSRAISDPVGLGTDHGNQLPVVATSRYSPPEYLFRLLEPSAELWHAVDIYQLGGLLHDLLMREPMFEAQYQMSQDNRYRFAWIVATAEPDITASDADQDLVLLARRALDKDYKRRSSLRLKDFRSDIETQRAHGLSALGFNTGIKPQSPPHRAASLKRIADITDELQSSITSRLKDGGITASHKILHDAADHKKVIKFEWRGDGGEGALDHISLAVSVALENALGEVAIAVSSTLSATVSGAARQVTIELPSFSDGETVHEDISNQVMIALGDLARRVMKAD